MRVGIPKELKDHEYRVAITPVGVRELVQAGHSVFVETGAGVGSAIADSEYEAAGATVLASADEVWGHGDLLLKVKEPIAEEFHRIRDRQVVFTYLHLAAGKPVTEALIEAGATAIAYETVELPSRALPLLAPMSEVAGRMAAQAAAHLLEREQGGRGVLMGGIPGVAPANVVVLGAGVSGFNAAVIAHGMGADVTILDTNVDKLRQIDSLYRGTIKTLMSSRSAIDHLVERADAMIGSVLIPGARAPKLVTAEHVAAMQTGSVIVDIAIDQGGCFETSRPTSHSHPTYVESGVVHYCVANMPGAVPRTSTYGLTNVTLPYILRLASSGADAAVRNDSALAKGVSLWNGKLVSEPVAVAHDLPWSTLESALG